MYKQNTKRSDGETNRKLDSTTEVKKKDYKIRISMEDLCIIEGNRQKTVDNEKHV